MSSKTLGWMLLALPLFGIFIVAMVLEVGVWILIPLAIVSLFAILFWDGITLLMESDSYQHNHDSMSNTNKDEWMDDEVKERKKTIQNWLNNTWFKSRDVLRKELLSEEKGKEIRAHIVSDHSPELVYDDKLVISCSCRQEWELEDGAGDIWLNFLVDETYE